VHEVIFSFCELEKECCSREDTRLEVWKENHSVNAAVRVFLCFRRAKRIVSLTNESRSSAWSSSEKKALGNSRIAVLAVLQKTQSDCAKILSELEFCPTVPEMGPFGVRKRKIVPNEAWRKMPGFFYLDTRRIRT